MAGEHPELDELREAFALDDLDRRIVVRVSRPLHPANQRLADFFGAKVVVIAEPGTAGTPVQELLESRDCIAYGCTLEADPGIKFCREHRQRREYGTVSPERLALAASVKRLREQERLQYDEIAERLGISRNYANDLYLDPDGSKARARKDGYRQPCPRCGGLMSGGEGTPDAVAAPSLCMDCAALVSHEGRYWTREAIVEAFQTFSEIHSRSPTTVDSMVFNPTIREKLSPERIAEGEAAVAAAPLPFYSTVVREFGSWPRALTAAGLSQNGSGYPAHRAPRRDTKRGATVARIYHVLHRNGDGGLHEQTVDALSAEQAIEKIADSEGEWIAVLDSAWFAAPVEPRSIFAVVTPAA